MTCPDLTLTIFPGQDWLDEVTPDDEGAPVDTTGWTAEIRDITGELTGAVAASVVGGKVRLALTWQASWATTGRVLGTFRMVVQEGATARADFPVTVIVSDMETVLTVARYADLRPQFTWDDDRMGADLTGDTIEVIHASPALAGIVSAGIVDAATRRVWFHIEGDPATPLGDLGTFQLRRSTAGANRRTTNLIRVICR